MKAQINEILRLFGEYALAHDYEKKPMLTAYVDVDTTNPENQRERPAWLIDLKNEAKRLEEEIGSERLKRRQAQIRWEKAEEMVLSYLQDRKPTGRSVALFTDLEDDFIAFDLPVPMITRLYYGQPQIKHLLFALDQYKKYLILLFSGFEIREAEIFLTRTSAEVTVESEFEKLRRLGRKSIEAGQDRRTPEFEGRFIKEVAEDINAYFLQDPDVERLVLGGNTRLAHGVYNALHPATKDIVVAVTSLDFKMSQVDIAAQIKSLANVYEEEHDLGEVAHLVSLHNRAGAVALGQEAVQEALEQGRIKSLILPYPMDATQFDPLITKAAIQGTTIEFVYGAAADELAQVGGMGAYLYYSLP
jgi:hypothetical protein